MTPRRTISTPIKTAVAERQAGLCDCGFVLLGTAELDHIVPLALGGDNEAANLRWRHRHCHKAKTARDIKMISKADRLRKKFGCRAKVPDEAGGREQRSLSVPMPVEDEGMSRASRGAATPAHFPSRKIPSRGFDKRFRKRMDGTVEARR